MKFLGKFLIGLSIYGVIFCNSILANENNYNVRLSLDLSNYDTFDEKIGVLCEGENGFEAIYELNIKNNYSYIVFLEPGKYKFQLSVKNDALGLIDLSPMEFELAITSDSMQDVIIKVTDSAGLSAEADNHSGVSYDSYDEELFQVQETESVPQFYFWKDIKQEGKYGVLHVKGPDVAGLKSLTYSLKDKNGETFCYLLNKSNHFEADIELPAGRYYESFEDVSITTEDGIVIPKGATFYCKYKGNLSGQEIKILNSNSEVSVSEDMQLWVRYDGGADVQVKNLYQYAGNSDFHNTVKEGRIIGHDNLDAGEVTETNNSDLDIAEDAEELQESSYGSVKSVFFGLVSLGIIVLIVIGIIIRRRYER